MVEHGAEAGAVRRAVAGAVGASGAASVALSGGLDSSVVAALLAGTGARCVSVAAGDWASPDLPHARAMARHAGMALDVVRAGAAEALGAAGEAIAALGTYSPMEVRSAAVACLALRAARERGAVPVATGDGADELFAGYAFLVSAPAGTLRARLDRLQGIMHFPALRRAGAMGVRAVAPFLDEGVVRASRAMPDGLLVREERGRRVGKWILRRAFERDVPHGIAWRQKVPMASGAGLDGLGALLGEMIPDADFAERARGVMERDGVRVRDKESLHYYEVRRRAHGPPRRAAAGAPACPDCGSDVSAGGARYCRMCGRFPL
ncbi:MAG: asparagine synthase-related protein [Thaumarchaeota archaeon]|nr:asparagine synthase-related protein [Nitrososphaerota archaeon]